MTTGEPYSTIEIKITTGDQERTVLFHRTTEVRMRTDRDLDPDVTLRADDQVVASFTADNLDVDFTFTAWADPETGIILQEKVNKSE